MKVSPKFWLNAPSSMHYGDRHPYRDEVFIFTHRMDEFGRFLILDEYLRLYYVSHYAMKVIE